MNEHEAELQLSDYEKGYLTSYWPTDNVVCADWEVTNSTRLLVWHDDRRPYVRSECVAR